MRYEPVIASKGRGKPPVSKIMTGKEAVSRFIKEDTYLGMSVSAAPAALIWEIVRQRDRIKTLDVVITSQIGMSSVLIGSGLVRKLEMAYNWGGLKGRTQYSVELLRKAYLGRLNWRNIAIGVQPPDG